MNNEKETKNSIIVVGLGSTIKVAESLLLSGYKVKIQYYDKVDDVDNMWITRRYIVIFEEDKIDGFPSTLDELFKDYDGPYPTKSEDVKTEYDPPKPGIQVDEDNVFEKFEVRKD